MRIVIAIAAVVLGSMIGAYYSAQMKKRTELLKKLVLMIESISIMIRYKAMPVHEILLELKKNEALVGLNFIEQAESLSRAGFSISCIWAEEVRNITALKDEDKEILINIGNELGGSDIEGQLSILDMSKVMILKQLDESKSLYLQKAKMYRTVGSLLGIIAAIIII